MKKIFKQIKTILVWFFDGRILDAINDGASYEDVTRLVAETEKRDRKISRKAEDVRK